MEFINIGTKVGGKLYSSKKYGRAYSASQYSFPYFNQNGNDNSLENEKRHLQCNIDKNLMIYCIILLKTREY